MKGQESRHMRVEEERQGGRAGRKSGKERTYESGCKAAGNTGEIF